MKKFIIFSFILFLVITTSLIKNSTKKIEDEIYLTKENIILLSKRYKNSKLEFNYLSSSENLMEYQKLYFENFLEKKFLENLKLINFDNNNIKIKDLEIVNKDEWKFW